MIGPTSTLADVCYAVSTALDSRGMTGVLTGGGAAALYAPNAYVSYDADFILENDDSLARVAEALEPIGYSRVGRSRLFAHPTCAFTVDFPKGPLSVGGDFVFETMTLVRDDLRLRLLTRVDCIRDRLAHFYHWNDFTALEAAVSVGAARPADVDLAFLRTWTERESPDLFEKFEEFTRRLGRATTRERD